MTAWPVTGHEWAVEHLDRARQHGRMRHAYLFTGPAHIGKTTLARAFAMALNCTGPTPPCGTCRNCKLIAREAHPDLTIVQSDAPGATLKIGQVRELQQTLALRPFEARYRVAILRRFHEAQPTAQDALLKTLEEPASDAILILTANSADNLLPTIVSRCQPLHLRPLPVEQVREALEWQHGALQDVAKTLARISAGRIGWAITAQQDESLIEQRSSALKVLTTALKSTHYERFALVEKLAGDKTAVLEMLDLWQVFWRDALLAATGSRAPITNYDLREVIQIVAQHVTHEAIHAALASTRQTLDLLRKNANTRLALEVLMLDYPKLAG